MKRYCLLVSMVALFTFSCSKNGAKKEPAFAKAQSEKPYAFNQSVEENGIIYEVNIRQYSAEGSFDAFTRDIPTLKELGVKIIWVMPIFPISETKRKGGLGSYYAVSDFREINPEFGTLQDVDEMIATAHENGIAIILDWVPNHTGWDHTWIKQHPEWYTQNEDGEIIDPVDPETGKSWGWTDVADLNYMNPEMRAQMIADLSYWVRDHDVDGFRMDVAHKVPVDFFKTAIDSLEQIKSPLFMLAEAEQVDLMDNGFDMHYAWQMHHLLNEMAKEEKGVEDFWTQLIQYDQTLSRDHINMYFITNHDENSWAGTLQERMPDNKKLFTALTYMLPGMPLVYSGQEYDLNKRLQFFEKDSIPKDRGAYFEFLTTLGTLKNNNAALQGGKSKASLIKIDLNHPEILSFAREKNDDQLIFIGNFSSTSVKTSFPYSGSFSDVISGEKVMIEEGAVFTLGAWQFKILDPVSPVKFNLNIVPTPVDE